MKKSKSYYHLSLFPTYNNLTCHSKFLTNILFNQNSNFFYFQSVSPGLVETEMSAQLNIKDLEENGTLKPIDIVEAILYALGAPKRVNVSQLIVIIFNSI